MPLSTLQPDEPKIVCCREGEQVLYPNCEHYTDWTDPIPDRLRIGTCRGRMIEWPRIEATFPNHVPLRLDGLSPAQETICIEPNKRIPFQPKLRGLQADVVLGIRRRQFAPEKNWQHWNTVADALRAVGISYAVVGDRSTSFDLDGSVAFSGNYDTDAAIELMQNCSVYVGSDTGVSHLAATIGANMVVFGLHNSTHRDMFPQMRERNPDGINVVDGWTDPQAVIGAVVRELYACRTLQ